MKKAFFVLICILTLVIILNGNNVYAHDDLTFESTDHQLIENGDLDRSGSSGSSGGGDGSLDEDWYNIGTSLPHAVDYSESDLLKYLKPGDLVYEDTGGFGITGHSAIVEGVFYDSTYGQYYVRLLEAVSDGVTRGLMTPTRFEEKEVSIYRLNNATSNQINNAINFFVNQLGKPYAISLTKNSSSNNPNWYCSELVWASYYWQGIYLDEQDNSPVWPGEIKDYEYATLIMDYRYSTTISSVNSVSHTLSCNGNHFIESHNYITINNCLKRCSICNYELETHNYTYLWKNYTQHQALCACGEMHNQGHAVSPGSLGPGQQYTTCLICGGPASMGIMPLSNNNLPYTINGSYILPNGVMVLVDDDIDAYLDGTLVFINPGEYINRSNSIPYILKREDEFLLD